MLHLQDWEVVAGILLCFGSGYGLGFLRGKLIATRRISKIIRGIRILSL